MMVFGRPVLAGLLTLYAGIACRSRTDSPARAADTAERTDRAALLDSLQRAEAGLWYAVQRQDSAALDRILAPDYVYLSAIGRKDRDKATELRMHIGSGLRIDSIALTHWRSRWIGDSAAVLDYLARAWGGVGAQADSQSGGALAIWERRNGRWQATVRTEWAVPWDGSNPSDSAVKRLRMRP